MLLKINKFIRDRRGQATVELAFVLPVFLLMMIGIFQFSFLLQTYITVTEAARAGAREAIVTPPSSGDLTPVYNAVQTAAPNLTAAPLTTTVTGSWASGAPMTVTVSYPVNCTSLGFLQGVHNSNGSYWQVLPQMTFILTATAVMCHE